MTFGRTQPSKVRAEHHDSRLPQDAPWEVEYGYTKAVVAGPWIMVSGPVSLDQADSIGQARAAFRDVLATTERAGARPSNVVRVRIFYTRPTTPMPSRAPSRKSSVGTIPLAATMVRVASLMLPQPKVEIDLDAYMDNAQ